MRAPEFQPGSARATAITAAEIAPAALAREKSLLSRAGILVSATPRTNRLINR